MLEAITGFLGIELTSGLIGASGGVVTYGFLNWNQRRIERDRFRRSLIFEIRHIGGILEQLKQADQVDEVVDQDELQAKLSTDLLDAEFHSIGKLTTHELQHVYRFYETSNLVRDKLKQESVRETNETLHRQIETALQHRDTALNTIKRSRLSQLTEWYKALDNKH